MIPGLHFRLSEKLAFPNFLEYETGAINHSQECLKKKKHWQFFFYFDRIFNLLNRCQKIQKSFKKWLWLILIILLFFFSFNLTGLFLFRTNYLCSVLFFRITWKTIWYCNLVNWSMQWGTIYSIKVIHSV